jgi:hypothetical protein
MAALQKQLDSFRREQFSSLAAKKDTQKEKQKAKAARKEAAKKAAATGVDALAAVVRARAAAHASPRAAPARHLDAPPRPAAQPRHTHARTQP